MWFQFLLGTLITAPVNVSPNTLGRFQFLLGTLITPAKNLIIPSPARLFQFLLGTLITIWHGSRVYC